MSRPVYVDVCSDERVVCDTSVPRRLESGSRLQQATWNKDAANESEEFLQRRLRTNMKSHSL